MSPLYPCFWFDHQAREAADFYLSVFPDAMITGSNDLITSMRVRGTELMLLNGGPRYHITPCMSLFVYCGSTPEIDRLYPLLAERGHIVMPLGTYDWSSRYAWVVDQFGIHWQLDVDEVNHPQKVVPCLLFTNDVKAQVGEASSVYSQIFPNSHRLFEMPCPPGMGMPEGSLLFAQIKVSGYLINLMSSHESHEFGFTPGTSLVVPCDNQEEIDYFWEKLGSEGSYSMCGWLEDRFGFSWQVIPSELPKLLINPETRARVVDAFMNMQKFDLSRLREAAGR